MRVLCSGLVAAMVATLLAVPAGAVEIRAVRLSAGPEGTRVVMDLSSLASHSVMTLKNPDRIVIDVSGAPILTDDYGPANLLLQQQGPAL